jgi:enamine deaminase RidA (YjgF/YER057c/UK114 family)
LRLRELYEIYPADPRATVPTGIRVDNWLFGSVSGVDPVTRLATGDMPAQVRAAAGAMRHVLARGGMQPINLKSVRVYRAREDPRYFAALQELFGGPAEYGGSGGGALPFSRTGAFQVYTSPKHLAPGQHVRIDFTATAGQGEWLAKLQTPDVIAPAPAIRIGPLLWAYDVTAREPVDGSLPDGGIEAQADVAFDNLERLLERAGIGRGQLLRIAGYMRDLKDKDVLNEAMVARFPHASERPVHQYVPAALPPGVAFALQAIALEGAERRIVEMEGIKHNDPISLGAIAGNVFVSSRVQARLEANAREQAARLIEGHARKLMEHVGGSLTDIRQMTWGIGDAAFEVDVREECSRVWPSGSLPNVDVIQAPFPHSPLPRLEFTALLG